MIIRKKMAFYIKLNLNYIHSKLIKLIKMFIKNAKNFNQTHHHHLGIHYLV